MNTRGLSVLSFTAAVIVCQQGTVGGVTPPPYWAGNAPNNTAQTWGFGSQWVSDYGNEPDAGWHNPNGVPGGSSDGATAEDAWLLTLDRRDGIMVLKPGSSVSFDVRNTPDDTLAKRISIRVIFQGDFTFKCRYWNNADPPQPTDLDPQFVTWWVKEIPGGNWLEAGIETKIRPNPLRELFIFTTLGDENLVIDKINIDTICGYMIPGPSGIALGLAFASLGVTRRRRVAAV